MATLPSYSGFTEQQGHIIWNFIIPELTNNRSYIYFRLYAKDKEGNTSGIINSTIPLIACRKVTPDIVIQELDMTNSLNGQHINIGLRINDYGGNEKTYDNFVRQEPGIEKMHIQIKYGDDLTNLKYTKQFSYDIIGKNTSLPPYEVGKTIIFPITFISEEHFTGKVYFRITISFDTNRIGGDYNKILAPVITQIYYSEGPTVSHRPHWVGINSTKFVPILEGGNDVVQISSFKERNLIKLRGEKGEQVFEITIDLNNGSISGATINGGTW